MALAGASGGAVIVLPTEEPGNRSTADFDFEFDDDMLTLSDVGLIGPGDPPCEQVETYRLWEIDQDPAGIGDLVIDGVDVLLGDNPWQGSFTLTEVPGGWYLFEVVCPGNGNSNGDDSNGVFQLQENGDIEPGPFADTLGFARLLVEVEVEGDVPEGTSFEVEVECWGPAVSTEPVFFVNNGADNDGDPTFKVNRSFEATGGSEQVVLYEAGDEPNRGALGVDFSPTVGDLPATCSVSQGDVEGAETTSDPAANSPVTIDIEGRDDYVVTFTNTFPTAVEEEEEDEPTDVEADEDEVEDEAEPAEPVEAEPDFTG